MKRIAFGIATLAGLLTTGCTKIVSLNPLYTEDVNGPDVGLEGRWLEVDGKGVCTVTESSGRFLLSCASGDESPSPRMVIRTVQLGNSIFLDVSPELTPDFGVAGHFFLQATSDGGELRVCPMDGAWVQEQCGTGLQCVVRGKPKDSAEIVITSPTPVLQHAFQNPAAFETQDCAQYRKLD